MSKYQSKHTPPYYLWTEGGDCPDKVDDIQEAIAWARADPGRYVADVNHVVVQFAEEPTRHYPHILRSPVGTLAQSLACYVTADDWLLPRERFIAMVADRIQDDLRDHTF